MSTLPFRGDLPAPLQRLLDSVEILDDGRCGWDYMAMYDVRDALNAKAAQPVALPKEPAPGLLMSMAIRYDHALGMPGFYDSELMRGMSGVTHAQRLESTLRTMRQLYEEVSGHGFYSAEKEASYAAAAEQAKRGRA